MDYIRRNFLSQKPGRSNLEQLTSVTIIVVANGFFTVCLPELLIDLLFLSFFFKVIVNIWLKPRNMHMISTKIFGSPWKIFHLIIFIMFDLISRSVVFSSSLYLRQYSSFFFRERKISDRFIIQHDTQKKIVKMYFGIENIKISFVDFC